MKRNGEKGFTTVDLSIAMIVVSIFVGIMGSIFYNVYLSSTEAKRTATALNYGVDIFEKIGEISYHDLTPHEVLSKVFVEEVASADAEKDGEISSKVSIGKTKGAYEITLSMTEEFNNEGLKALKYFKLTITYDVAAKTNSEKIELERIRTITNKLKTDEEAI